MDAVDGENQDAHEDDGDGENDYGGLPVTRSTQIQRPPLVLDDVSDELATDDSLLQDVILDSIFQNSQGSEISLDTYRSLPLSRIKLSRLKSIKEKNLFNQAFNIMKTKWEIEIDPKYSENPLDPQMGFDLQNHYLDFCLAVSAAIGFDAVLPNSANEHLFVFNLDLHQPSRGFKSKHADLTFSLARRALFFGSSRGKDDVWVFFAPQQYFSVEGVTPNPSAKPRTVREPTNIKVVHYWMFVMFMAHVYEKALPSRHIYCVEKYPDVFSDAYNNVIAKTNILTNAFEPFYHQDLIKFNRVFVREWSQWVADAPALWKIDGFLESHTPITGVSRYGQDQRIADRATMVADALAWSAERDGTKIRFLHVAIATKIGVTKMGAWQDCSPQEQNPAGLPVYDSADTRNRRLVDLPTHPISDEEGFEIPLHREDGTRLKRRTGMTTPNQQSSSVLVNLDNIRDLYVDPDTFSFESDMSDSDNEPSSRPGVHAYRQSCFQSVGHTQATALPVPVQNIVNRINDLVAVDLSGPESGGDDDDDDDDYVRDPSTAVVGTCTQMYNTFMHRARPTAREHDAQRGMVTAALSGSYAQGIAHKRKASKMKSDCDDLLPQARFERRTGNGNLDTSLRVEIVVRIEVNKLKPEVQSGGEIYKQIIIPLAESWSEGPAFRELKKHLFILCPGIYPDCIGWATYGIHTLIKKLYLSQADTLSGGREVSPYLVELASVLERTFAFAHTGNVRVIASKLMNSLLVGYCLIEHGTPLFHKCLNMGSTATDRVHIPPELWPCSRATKQPFVGSKRSQIFNYGVEHWEVFYAVMRMRYASVILPAGVYPQYLLATRRCLVVGCIAVEAFLADVRALVSEGVKQDTADALQSTDERAVDLAQERLQHLKTWMTGDKLEQFSLGGLYAPLMRAVNPPRSPLALVLGDKQSMSTLELAALIYDGIKPGSRVVKKPPFWKGASSINVFRVAFKVMSELADRGDGLDRPALFKRIIALVFDDLKIFFIPWSPPHLPNVIGRAPSKTSHRFWRMTSKVSATAQTGLIQVMRADEILSMEDSNIASAAQLSNAKAEWTINDRLIKDMPAILHKTELPADFDIIHASIAANTDPYVFDTYQFVKGHYRGHKVTHQFALLVAHIFSRVSPKLSHPSPSVQAGEIAKGQTALMTQRVRNEPWIIPKGIRKGLTERLPFIVMVTTSIIALAEPSSPLRVYLERQKGLGTIWTTKHSQKYISPFNLVRMGIAYAHGPAIYTSPKYGTSASWSLKSTNDIEAQAKRFIATLKNGPFGPYLATAEIFGKDVADFLSHDSEAGPAQFCAPPIAPSLARPGISSSSKRGRDGETDDDDYGTELFPVNDEGRRVKKR
ncbi:hypothetical protein HWV62_15669 [Athelia sp. TMB]|nr:hypothetical protein HWV62_15669 [Athelia sp. TMB]